MKKVTLQDVADHAAVSKSTVSQYLNGRYTYMGERTKRRIEESIRTLQYQPNAIARSLKQKKTTTIGVIMANILHRVSTQTSRAIEDFCHAKGYHVILCNADDDSEKEKQYIEMLKAKQVDGFIIYPTASNEEMYKSLLDEKYPVVFLDRKVKALSIPTLTLRNEEAMDWAIEHLKNQGNESIAYISSPLTISPRTERYDGFLSSMKRHGLTIQQDLIYTDKLSDSTSFLKKIFSPGHFPDAILSSNDRSLVPVLDYLKKTFKGVPEHLSILTFDEVEYAEFFQPSITTVEQPAFEMGTKAAELLIDQIDHDGLQHLDDYYFGFQGKLNIRESSLKRGRD
ncbi:LacI family DNA-binding transcriptional regulator [Alkalicoccus luteus]|uniref:LacI family transcriptional regulator n=1 Tax=Alkalicoccus luteus TaxID=1237094 RepID=A0A969PS11_9BACI|nr:substrate-binding domain-containing protein [Alkalicoccus luteus]NJP37994.1 LacI family transcriptional regulator [Alkalicoccus luteus]